MSNTTNCLKVHRKHYHMPSALFCHRTSNLRLPDEIYELYKQVAQEVRAWYAEETSLAEEQGDRSKCRQFGGLFCVDHADAKHKG